MITKEQFKTYNQRAKNIIALGEGYSFCFHCNEPIKSREDSYSICREANQSILALFFHEDCFKDIAGEDYLLNPSLTGLLNE